MEETNKITHQVNKTSWIPQKEKKWIYLALGVSVIIVFYGLWNIFHLPSTTFHTRSFKFQFMNYGSLARIALFIVLAYYVLSFIWKKGKFEGNLKKWGITLIHFARAWHTPVAIIAFGLIILHVIAAFLYGFQFDFHNLSGLLALLILIPVPVAGLLRYRRMDRKWHLRLGLVFTVFFLLHAFV